MSSRESSFNFSNSELKLVFASGAEGAKTELLGVLQADGELRVRLQTPSGKTWKGSLRTDQKPEFTSQQYFNWSLSIQKENEAPTEAVLNLNKPFQQVKAPPGADLPEIIELSGGVSFAYLGETPVSASSVVYFPLSEKLEVRFGQGTRLVFPTVSHYLEAKSEQKTFTGRLVTPSSRQYEVLATASEEVIYPKSLPPQRLRGYFRASPSSPKFGSISYFEYLGTTSNNPSTFPFIEFPAMRLVMLVCNKSSSGKPFQQSKAFLNLVSIDPLERNLVFEVGGGQGKQSFIGEYAKDWQEIRGYFVSSGGSVTSRPYLFLSPDSSLGNKGCEEL